MHVPDEGSQLTINLPGEVLRSTVKRVIDHMTLLVEISDGPMAKTHQYHLGDIVAVRREIGFLNQTEWRPIEERRTLTPPVAPTPEPAAPKKKKAKKPAGLGAGAKRPAKKAVRTKPKPKKSAKKRK